MMIWIKSASLLMLIAVALGAFGAHALKAHLSDYSLDVYKTAFAVAWIASYTNDPKAHYAGLCFLAGIVLFSGSLYLLSVTGIKWLGAITPLGGICFLAGWFILLLTKAN